MRSWHPTGKLEYEIWYDHGRRTGVWRWWNEQGKLVKKVDYRKGSKEPLERCVPSDD